MPYVRLPVLIGTYGNMRAMVTLPLEATRFRARLGRCSGGLFIAVLFASLPLLLGALYRTYQYEVFPSWFEVSRQLDLVILALEIVTICCARRDGMDYRQSLRRLPVQTRRALIFFLATFWIGALLHSRFLTYSLVRAAGWPIHILFAVALWHFLHKHRPITARTFIFILCAGYAAYLPLLSYHLLTAPPGASLHYGAVIWASSLPGYLSVRIFGMEIGVILTLLLGLVWREADVTPRSSINMLLITAAACLLCWSGTRSAVFGVAGAVMITAFFRRPLPRWSVVCAVVMAIVAGGAASSFMLPPDPAFGFRIVEHSLKADYSAGRVEIWTAALRLIMQRPLTGWGDGSFIWLFSLKGAVVAQPHNAILQMLQAWGLPAAFAALFMIGRIWWALNRRGTMTTDRLPFVMAFDTLLIMSMVDGVFFHARLIMLAVIIATFGLAACSGRGRALAGAPE
jgi:O-antigen ligase